MRWARWITLPWPGLTQLWFDGAWWGLGLGCGFAWLACLATVSTFVWYELLDPGPRLAIWAILVATWGVSVRISLRRLRGMDAPVDGALAEDLFREAQREYLKGNWIEAEQLLTRLIRTNSNDIDAQLMLVGLLRRTGQWTEASHRLRRLQASEGSEKWSSEIGRERKLLDELFQSKQSTSQTTETTEQTQETPDPQQLDNESSPATQAA